MSTVTTLITRFSPKSKPTSSSSPPTPTTIQQSLRTITERIPDLNTNMGVTVRAISRWLDYKAQPRPDRFEEAAWILEERFGEYLKPINSMAVEMYIIRGQLEELGDEKEGEVVVRKLWEEVAEVEEMLVRVRRTRETGRGLMDDLLRQAIEVGEKRQRRRRQKGRREEEEEEERAIYSGNG